jgi:hypothetical protein
VDFFSCLLNLARRGPYNASVEPKKHWGEWVKARAAFVGYHRLKDLALTVGCSDNQLTRWTQSRSAPSKMRKGFDRALASALQTNLRMLFHDYVHTSADEAASQIKVQSDSTTADQHSPGGAVISIRDFEDADLIREVARRYRIAQLDFLNEAARAKEFDWEKAADLAEALSPGDKTPDYVRQAMVLLGSAQAKFNRIAANLDVEKYCIVHHEELPGGSRPIGDFEMVSHGDEWERLEQLPGINRLGAALRQNPDWLNSPIKKLDDEYQGRQRQYARAVAERSRAESERLGLQPTKKRRKTAG